MNPQRTPTPDSEQTVAATAPVQDVEKGEKAAPAAPPAQPPAVAAEVKEVQQSKKRYVLLSIFCVALFLDVAARSGLFVFIHNITEDLGVPYETSTWILNSYTITFGAVLPLAGRVADLFSAKPVFIAGFAGFGLCNIIISVLPEQYSYFVLRGLSGVFAGATIPAAFRLIASVFQPKEIPMAMTVFSLAGALGNSLGLVFGGIVGLIPTSGQMAGWRWFFRIVGFITLPFCILAWRMCPKTTGSRAKEVSKLRQLDLPGGFLILAPNTLLVLGLTLGASYGWKTPKFLVPFLLCWPLFVAFFTWEARLLPKHALVPTSFWKTQNVAVLLFAALEVLSWWSIVQLPLIERFEAVYGESRILAGVRCLPNGIAAFAVAVFTPINIRATMTICLAISSLMFILFIYSHGQVTQNNGYWRYIFPAMAVGSAADAVAFTAVNITILKSVPPEMAGVAGAFLQVAYQLGSALGLGIQSGLLSVHPGNVTDFSNVQISWWFQFGWAMTCAIVVGIFLRDPKKPPAPSTPSK